MAEIIWAKSARNDLKSIYDYIAEDSENKNTAAGKIVPEFGDKTIREIKEGNYRIIYQIRSSDKVDILRVHHSARLLTNI